MDTRPDVLSEDSQLLFDLEYAERILEEERTQLAAAKIALALALKGLLEEDLVPVETLREAIARHEAIIRVVCATVSTPEPV